MSFLIIPLTTLHDEYTDRQKLTEQKTPFELTVPPPLNWTGMIKKAFIN